MPTIGERLIQLKRERNLLQKDIARETGLSLRAYQYYERDQKDPTAAVLQKLADYFDVSTDYLLGRSDDPAQH